MSATKATEVKEMAKNVNKNNRADVQAGKAKTTANQKRQVGTPWRKRNSFIELEGQGLVNLKLYPSASLVNTGEILAIVLREKTGNKLWVNYTEFPDAQEAFTKIWNFLTPAKNSLCIEGFCIIPMEMINQVVPRDIDGVSCLLILGGNDTCLSIISSADFNSTEEFESVVREVKNMVSGLAPNEPITLDSDDSDTGSDEAA